MSRFMESSKKIITFVLVAAIAFIAIVANPKAVTDTINIGDPEDTPAYIGGRSIGLKKTTDGGYLYCLEMSKKTPKNVTATLTGERDAGIASIITNGFPMKSLTGVREKDYYITQLAIWWYLDEVNGTSNVSENVKSTGADPEGLRQYVRQLVEQGLAAREAGYPVTTVTVNTDSNLLTIAGNYYESKAIQVTTTANEYKVTLEGATENTKTVSTTSNEEKTTFNKDEAFKIKVPADEINKPNFTINVTIEATGTVYKAYQYTPADSNYQVVTPGVIEPVVEKVSTNIALDLITTKVTVTKSDANTNNPLPGAVLVLKNSAGEEITNWTSTNDSHVIRNLTAGTYSISEKKAPEGYELSKDVVTFTISNESDDVTVNFVNKQTEKTVINITKISAESGNALAGAVLVIKDADGKEVERFTTTNEAHVITGLAYGTYTLSEISAPAGYKKSDEIMTITLDDDHISYQIKYANYQEIEVPNTASSSIIFTILGIAIIGSGLGFVYRNGKKA